METLQKRKQPFRKSNTKIGEDDEVELLKKYFCNCQCLKPKRDCLEQRESVIMIYGTYKAHEHISKIIVLF